VPHNSPREAAERYDGSDIMKLGLIAGYSGAQMGLPMELILGAEAAGFDSIWTGEAYGSDVITPLAWIGALTKKIKLGAGIMQMPGRSPAMTAMTAMTLDALSGGRFILGVGPSGPQVAEGWHGMPYGKPLQLHGKEFDVPYTGPGSTGLGKPLKSILHGRKDMKIYSASISPKGLELAAEITDGVLPIWMSPEKYNVIGDAVKAGLAKGNKTADQFDVAPFVTCVMGPDVEKCRQPVKANMALYIGGMGARSRNFYNDYATRLGYPAEAKEIQDLYLGGKKNEAMAAIPDKLVDEVALVGPKERIIERLKAWKASPIKTMLIGTGSLETVRMLAEACA
jgi:alkanesulfonate monooxygenase SsuD/methylene tetrahydromethanopterin reductase-like flavin-dependent oxidoreductase (luciferase family)